MPDKTKTILAKALNKATLVVSKKVEGDEGALLSDFHKALISSKLYQRAADGINISRDELVDIVSRLREYGFSWDKGVYIPLQAFCEKKPLGHILHHKEELLGKKGREAFSDEAIKIKNMFMRSFVGMFFRY